MRKKGNEYMPKIKKTVVLGVAAPAEVAEKVRAIAEKDRRSVSQTILIWIENELNRRENKQ